VADSGGFGESAQAVAALFALPSDFGSIGLHKKDSTQRNPTRQEKAQRDALRWIGGMGVGGRDWCVMQSPGSRLAQSLITVYPVAQRCLSVPSKRRAGRNGVTRQKERPP
jgi:hypothetical protein